MNLSLSNLGLVWARSCGFVLKAVALLIGFTFVAGSANASSDSVSFERAGSGVAATLVDHGDYYVRPNGQVVKFLRKKDIYVVREKSRAGKGGSRIARKSTTAISPMQRFKNQFGDRVKSVSRHQLGSNRVIRIDNRQNAKIKSKQSFDVSPEMLKALDASVESLMPVFTPSKGGADLLLLPRITLEMTASDNQAEELKRLESKYGLTLVRKLRLSADTYSLVYKDTNLPANVMFTRSRKIMSEASVAWAEPQFFVKPVKEQFVSTDPMFAQQWNLENRSYRGSRCDTDCDATSAWASFADSAGALTGGNVVIAVIDDGVQRDHPDLMANMWVNTVEQNGLAGVDDDMNGYIDDIHGYDFVTDDSTTVCANGEPFSDGDTGPAGDGGQDNNPSPRATANCLIPGVLPGENPVEDNHGTAVAGIIAARGNNGKGITGVAYDAQIMAIRAISDFDEEALIADDEPFCDAIAEAIEYAAQHADVINNSWSLPIICSALETALTNTTTGTVTAGLGSKRNSDGRNGLGAGSPVIFASGNDGSGWVKVTVPVPTAGPHAYEWRLLRSAFPEEFDDFVGDDGELIIEGGLDDDTVWLDDITWPDQSTESFEPGSELSQFTTAWAFNGCNASCDADLTEEEPVWTIEDRAQFVRSGTQSARIHAVVGGNDSVCGNSYLHQIKDGPAGEISFWVWVSTDTRPESDRFEFLIDGVEKLSYGDLGAFGLVDNSVAYPARTGNRALDPTNVIAVGASNSGDLSTNTSALLSAEERVSYSQFGPTLDLVAPSSNQHLGITTTDRTGSDGYEPGNYTSNFGGTSAAAPVVSGVAAVMLAINPSLDASDVKQMLRDSADKIGPVDYDVSGRNDFHGFGRVNMTNALRLADGDSIASLSNPDPMCFENINLDYQVVNDLLLPRYTPQQSEFCPALGPMVPDESLCLPIKTQNDSFAVICL